jgi:hypothetical protein
MKLNVIFMSIALVVFTFANSQVKRATTIKAKTVTVNTEVKDFYEAAVEVSSNERSTLYEMKKKARLATDDSQKRSISFANITLKRGFALAGEVARTKGKISSSQYSSFQRELGGVDADLNKIGASGTNASGNPEPGTMGSCFKSCDDYGGSGFGGGKGWKRFTCKAACVVTKLPPGN